MPDKAMWICKVCGNNNPATYSFCSYCGTKRFENPFWICFNCGRPIFFDKFKYCIYCGVEKGKKKEIAPVLVKPTSAQAKIKEPVVRIPRTVEPEIAIDKSLIKDVSMFTHFCPPGYKLVKNLGHGGYCIVFEAIDPKNHKVALKIPKISMFETTSKQVFEQIMHEAKVWKTLSDKEKQERREQTIAQVFDYGDKPVPWISIELMEGGSLHERLKDGPLELKEALKISLRIADALHFAHHLGVVHFDVKPKNVLFDTCGNSKVTDWGLARILLEDSQRHGFEGTIICAAPEQLDPEKFGKPDWKCDIYGLGVTLYWMLSGRPPFYSDNVSECINMIISKEPTPLRSINASIPRELSELVLKLLAKQKKERPEGMILVKKVIEEILQKI